MKTFFEQLEEFITSPPEPPFSEGVEKNIKELNEKCKKLDKEPKEIINSLDGLNEQEKADEIKKHKEKIQQYQSILSMLTFIADIQSMTSSSSLLTQPHKKETIDQINKLNHSIELFYDNPGNVIQEYKEFPEKSKTELFTKCQKEISNYYQSLRIKAPNYSVISLTNQATDLIKELPRFIKHNQEFHFNNVTKENIENLNKKIEKFYKDPVGAIDGSHDMSFEQIEFHIAKYRAKIEEYRQFLQLHDPRHLYDLNPLNPLNPKDAITPKINDLKKLKERAKSKDEENAIDNEIQSCEALKLLYRRQQDLKPQDFLEDKKNEWAYERAHFKLAQDEGVIQEIKKSLEYQLKNTTAPEKNTTAPDSIKQLQELNKFYDALLKYFETEKSKGKWPTYNGFIASQAPTIPYSSPKAYQEKLEEIITNTKASLPQLVAGSGLTNLGATVSGAPHVDPKFTNVLDDLETAINNYPIDPVAQAKQKDMDTFKNIEKRLKKNYKIITSIYNEIFLKLKNDPFLSLDDMHISELNQPVRVNDTIKKALNNESKTLNSTEIEFLEKLYKILNREIITQEDKSCILEHLDKLKINIKHHQTSNAINSAKKEISFCEAFIRYYDSTTPPKVPTYDGFLASQAPSLSMSKDQRDSYLKDFKEQAKSLDEAIDKKFRLPSSQAPEIKPLQDAADRFPHSSLIPDPPSTYDPQIVPVYTEFMESLAVNKKDIKELKWDDKGKIIGVLPSFDSYFEINAVPTEKNPQSYEENYIKTRICQITDYETKRFQQKWLIEQKKQIEEKSNTITEKKLDLKKLEEKIKKVKELKSNLTSATPSNTGDIETKLKQETHCDDYSHVDDWIAAQEKQSKSKKEEIEKLERENSELTSKVKEVEFLQNALNNSTGSSIKSEVLYSNRSNPVKKVEYFISENSSAILVENETGDNNSYVFKAPTMAEYAKVTYENKASLYIYKDGKIGVPAIPLPSSGKEHLDIAQFEANEDEFTMQILKKYDQSSPPIPSIHIEGFALYDEKYSDKAKQRILSKLVLRYCMDENGKIDKEKFRKIKISLMIGGTLTHEDISKNLHDLDSPSALRKSEYYQLILKEKKKESIFGEAVTKDLTPARSELQKFKEKICAQRDSQLFEPNVFRRACNTISSFSENKENKITEYLQVMVDASPTDFNKVMEGTSPGVELTLQQKRIEEARVFLEKKSGISGKELKKELEHKRNTYGQSSTPKKT